MARSIPVFVVVECVVVESYFMDGFRWISPPSTASLSLVFIRRSLYRRAPGGPSYANFRLVRSTRVGGRVKQITLANLGSGFDLQRQDWPALCQLVESLAAGQPLPPRAASPALLQRARAIARQIVDFHGLDPDPDSPVLVAVDTDSLQNLRPRSVGVEHAALWALRQLGLPALLDALGLSKQLRACALGSIVGRLAGRCSERSTNHWLRSESALGELLGTPFESICEMQLYRASDALVKHRRSIEKHLFQEALSLFDLQPTVTLYDLTNTYFEGRASAQPDARRGHSKERRSDCPLLTLALVLDASGFVRRSQVFAGNACEAKTLQKVLEGLAVPQGSHVVLDRGIATEETLAWLREQGYFYLAVSREAKRQFDRAEAQALQTASGEEVLVHKLTSEDGKEARLHCYSRQRHNKEQAIEERRAQRLEQELEKLHAGLSRPRARRKLEAVQQRVGRICERSQGASQHYRITVEADEAGQLAAAVRWQREPKPDSRATHPGVYCLRSNDTSWEAAAMWRAYIGLTDVEAVFRCLKSELGLRPIYHSKPERSEGHLFITVLAYQAVQVIRRKLKQHGEHASWTTLRAILGTQRRVTTTIQCANGQTLHLRRTTPPEDELQPLYQSLGIAELPGKTSKIVL